MPQRVCPKCRQAIVSCNDYVYCWRFDGDEDGDGCHMRQTHLGSGHTIGDHDSEEDFLEWLFFGRFPLEAIPDQIVFEVDVPETITITKETT